jgi:hypothetical protein
MSPVPSGASGRDDDVPHVEHLGREPDVAEVSRLGDDREVVDVHVGDVAQVAEVGRRAGETRQAGRVPVQRLGAVDIGHRRAGQRGAARADRNLEFAGARRSLALVRAGPRGRGRGDEQSEDERERRRGFEDRRG